jgi:hypothetical protein
MGSFVLVVPGRVRRVSPERAIPLITGDGDRGPLTADGTVRRQ